MQISVSIKDECWLRHPRLDSSHNGKLGFGSFLLCIVRETGIGKVDLSRCSHLVSQLTVNEVAFHSNDCDWSFFINLRFNNSNRLGLLLDYDLLLSSLFIRQLVFEQSLLEQVALEEVHV
jgi:hypothetical protein